ncbi:MAG: pyridoxal-phosphate dependent enzyme, partial [Acidimicrobiales bacterium]
AELASQVPGRPLTVVTPLGGGGLASGLALWAADGADVTVVGVEPVASPAVGTAVAAGRIVPVPVGATIADGLSGNLEAGSPTPAILGEAVAAGRARIERVTEEEISAAMSWLFAAEGLVVEGAGAAGLAAVLAGRVPATGPLVVLLTGRNVSAATYAPVLLEPPR